MASQRFVVAVAAGRVSALRAEPTEERCKNRKAVCDETVEGCFGCAIINPAAGATGTGEPASKLKATIMKTLVKFVLAATVGTTCFVGGLSGGGEQPAGSRPQPRATYVASANRAPFHLTTCRWADGISSRNLQTFATREEAITAGHRPCKVCNP